MTSETVLPTRQLLTKIENLQNSMEDVVTTFEELCEQINSIKVVAMAIADRTVEI